MKIIDKIAEPIPGGTLVSPPDIREQLQQLEENYERRLAELVAKHPSGDTIMASIYRSIIGDLNTMLATRNVQ